jgi:hypothetical protein
MTPKAKIKGITGQNLRVKQVVSKVGEVSSLPPDATPKFIEAQISELRLQGPVAPSGVWIETSKSGSGSMQVYWQSRSPCFISTRSGGNTEARVKRKYIGKPNSTEHKAALAEVSRRNEILKLEKKLNQKGGVDV